MQEDIEGEQLEPTEEREIDIVAPDDDDEDEGQGIVGEKIDAKAFIEKMKGQGFRPLDELIAELPRITVDQKKELVRQAALEGKGLQTDATPITPNIAVVNDEGKVVQITTADGQLQAVQEFDPDNPNRGGKLNLFFSTNAKNKVQVGWIDGKGRQHAGYSVEYTKGQAIKKFEKIKKLAKSIPQIEKRCKQDIIDNSKSKEAALAVALIHDTYRRVGSGESKVTWDGEEGRPGPKKDKDGKFIREYVSTFGVTSFQAQHIIVKGKKVHLNFLGKSGKLNNVEVTNPIVKAELISRKKASTKKTDVILNVSPPAVNEYLKEAAGGDFSVKNFRTYHGTRLAADLVAKTKIPKLDKKRFDAAMLREIKKGNIKTAEHYKESAFLWALKERNKLKIDTIGEPISERLSNTKQVCIAQYIDPFVFKDWDSSFEDDTQKLIRSRFPAAAAKAVKEKAKNPPKAKGKRKAAPKRKKK
jgi:DNA topoisomerase-1